MCLYSLIQHILWVSKRLCIISSWFTFFLKRSIIYTTIYIHVYEVNILYLDIIYCFHILVIMKKATINIILNAFWLTNTLSSLEYIPKSRNVGLYNWLMFKRCKNIFQSGWNNLYFYQKMSVPLPLNTLEWSHVLDVAIKLAVHCYNSIISYY